ncbi:MAG TPA: YchJ family metal-binding protein [Burkholderiales bacterium]|jgi:SEC-C motif domain protein|nr:YchJ family metal-binding protein [Burkholderiales bacterium]
MSVSSSCPCGSGSTLAECCGPLHGGIPAATAEALMRARYSAYALDREDYVLATWHPSTRPTTLDMNPKMKWIGLNVKAYRMLDADHALVEFVARCKIGGRAHRMHERSRFVRENGQWFYVRADDDVEKGADNEHLG